MHDETEPLEQLPEDPVAPMKARWAIKRYRNELIAAGALVPGRGRLPSFYRPKLWRQTIDELMTRDAKARLERENAA